MTSSHLTHQIGLERIDDLRREAEAWRSVKLARAELDPPPLTPRTERLLQPNQRPHRAVATLKPHRAS